MDTLQLSTYFIEQLSEQLVGQLLMACAFAKELETLPPGSISYKMKRGRLYAHLQYREGEKVRVKYIRKAEVALYEAKVARRKELALSLNQLRKYLEAMQALYKELGIAFPEIPERLPVVPPPKSPSPGFYPEGRIHRTARGDMVRSKSEANIADKLYYNNVNYEYEAPLRLGDITVHTDFKAVMRDGQLGYWEHLGMMKNEEYRRKWERKRDLYRQHGIVEGKNLIVTSDDDEHGLDSIQIQRLIDAYF